MYRFMKSTLMVRRAQTRFLRRARHIGSWLLVATAGAALCVGLPWLVWKGPYILDARYIDEKTVGDGTGSAALVTGLRTALVACVAALGAGVAILYTARTYRLTRRGQVTDRFTKALERLGSEKLYVRIGGILALEQIVQDAPEQATDAARVLNAFLRDSAPRARKGEATDGEPGSEESEPQAPLPDEPAADIQVALTALTRRESRTHVDRRERLDLRGLHLAGVDLTGADLTEAVLDGATLNGANLYKSALRNASLVGAALKWANLYGATFTRANLREATLNSAVLAGTKFTNADLYAATFVGASLTQADFTHANLASADLTGTQMTKVTLTHADLRSAKLDGADLGKATLTRAQLGGADLGHARGLTTSQLAVAVTDSKTILPPHLLAACPPSPSELGGSD